MNFQDTYKRDDYLSFFRDTLLPDDFDIAVESVPLDFKTNRITTVNKIGEAPSLDLPVFEIKHKSENDPRVTLSKEAFRILANYGKQQALILFISTKAANYRLSLVTLDLKLEGRRVTKEFSNPRRYSFFLGPQCKAHTPQQYLSSRIRDLDDLKNRFSIEVVNRDFYRSIAKLFTELAGGQRDIGANHIDAGKGSLVLPGSKDEKKKKEFAVRLIGRLVFCWFLKKKHSDTGLSLVPEEVLSARALKANRLYYHHILEPLFFETLNKPVEKRHKMYRNTLWDSIPFLNGGLFDPHSDDYYKFDEATGLSAQYINTLKVPDDKLKELLDLFETYNFTIDENTPVDIELSIDPEMLGRIFENLLAEINPETGDTARKATGSYYTPREIVEYMVDESLKQYLLAKTDGENESIITSLLKYTDETPDIDEDLIEDVLDALYKIKILDPACGSGAFPMGALQKILLILQKIDPDSKRWLSRILDNIEDETVKRYLETHINADYVHKLGIIRDSIYGVDIQQIATEISKLRVFLSLIIDENVSDTEPNRGIEPLPNLEFKFVCANTLVGLGKNINLTSNKAQRYQRKLEKLRKKYLSSYGEDKKAVMSEYNETRSKLSREVLLWTGAEERVQQLSRWNPFGDEPCSWFDVEFMFGVDKGFDLVIGNPPYIDSETMVNLGLENLRSYLVSSLNFTRGNWDIYIAFFEVGFNLLSKSGVITYISPDKWISKPFGYQLRKNLLPNYLIITESGRDVFESANVDSIITFIGMAKSSELSVYKFMDEKVQKLADIPKQMITEPFTFDWLFSDHIKFLTSIERFTSTLSEIGTCDSACATSDAYKLKEFIIDISGEAFNPEEHLKIINTGTIDRYISKWGRREMTYLRDKYMFPAVKKSSFLKAFTKTYGVKSLKEKLIVKGLTLLDVCYDTDGEVIPGKSTLIVTSPNEQNLKFILGLLNSKLPIFYIKEKYRGSSYNQGINFNKGMINNFPIPEIDDKQKHEIVKIVNEIIKIKKNDPDAETIRLEQQIDQIVYKLYGLAEEEVAIVEARGE